MSTNSFAPVQSLSGALGRTATIAAAIAAIAFAVIVIALNSGTTQSSSPTPVTATPTRSITPAGVDMAQTVKALAYRRSFVGHH